MFGKATPRGCPASSIPIEIATSITQGLVLHVIFRLATVGYAGICLRLLVAVMASLYCVVTGEVSSFGRNKVPPVLRVFNDAGSATDATMWNGFVWGKYLAVAFLEIATCTARLFQNASYDVVFTWVTHLLLAFNIAECAAIECRAAMRHKGSGITSSAWLNVGTGIVLTILTVVQPLRQLVTITGTGFDFNHPAAYTIGYAFWNIKFASLLQDNATLWHIGHSHAWSLASWACFGTDYMDFRVGSLLYHFTAALITSKTNPKMQKQVGYAAFYDHLMGTNWMNCMAWTAAAFTAILTAQVLG